MEKLAKAPMNRKSLTKVTEEQSTTSLTDMNDDCLTKVFVYLDVVSLVNLARMNKRLNKIFTYRVIPKTTVQFDLNSQKSPISEMLKLFGKGMTRISIKYPNDLRFVNFLQLLTVYGKPGKLQQLTIDDVGIIFEDILRTIRNVIETIRPYFENIHTLSIVNRSHCASNFIDYFMENMPKHNLRHFCFHNVASFGEWLSVESLPSLQSFRLYNDYSIHAIHELMRYIAEEPPLHIIESIIHDSPRNLVDQENIQIELLRHIPNITQIGLVNNNSAFGAIPSNAQAKWQHLADFTNLKNFSLKSSANDFKDSGEVFRILANQNTIEYLELISASRDRTENNSDPVQFDHMRRMTHVKSLQLVDFGRSHSDDFVGKLFENLTGLHTCTIVGSQLKQAPIIKLVRTNRNLRVLNMIEPLTLPFYRELVKIRQTAYPVLVDQPLVIRVPNEFINQYKSEIKRPTYKPTTVAIELASIDLF